MYILLNSGFGIMVVFQGAEKYLRPIFLAQLNHEKVKGCSIDIY